MTEINPADPILSRIKEMVESNDVVLFMKGTAKIPQCGFSSVVAQVLGNLGVNFKDVNVLAEQDIREGVKMYSDWPTIPQLYIKGEFLGGSDIVREMYQSGELQAMLKENNIPFTEQAA